MKISNHTLFDLDRCILEFDKALRILYGRAGREPTQSG